MEHSFDRFEEGKNMILTLKDSAILDEEAMDTLENHTRLIGLYSNFNQRRRRM